MSNENERTHEAWEYKKTKECVIKYLKTREDINPEIRRNPRFIADLIDRIIRASNCSFEEPSGVKDLLDDEFISSETGNVTENTYTEDGRNRVRAYFVGEEAGKTLLYRNIQQTHWFDESKKYFEFSNVYDENGIDLSLIFGNYEEESAIKFKRANGRPNIIGEFYDNGGERGFKTTVYKRKTAEGLEEIIPDLYVKCIEARNPIEI